VKTLRRLPPILVGAYLLAGLSLVWSGYAIHDLMKAGLFGLTVAVAGDIGWITVMWAEHKRIGPRWAAPVVGWVIALGVGLLLVLHGIDAQSTGQAIAGPFVVLVGKAVGSFALLSLRDPAALTPEQEAEIHDVIRNSAYTFRLHHAQLEQLDRETEAEIARIRAESRVTLARDDADFAVALERLEKRAAIERKSPLALTAAPNTEQDPEQIANTTPIAPSSSPNATRDRIAEQAVSSANPARPDQPNMADVVRDQIARTANNSEAVERVLAILPDAKRESVAAAVRRERRKGNGGYN
jgi:hypothetical protein